MLLAASVPTVNEQYLLELINRARTNPGAEAARYGIDLNEGLAAGTISPTPKQPVAMNLLLVTSARGHAQWMIDNDVFSHTGVNGTDPAQRMATAGYVFNPPFSWGENLAWVGTRPATPDQTASTSDLERDLFVDQSVGDRGHRLNLMNDDFREAGTGIVSGDFQGFNAVMLAQDFANSAGPMADGGAFLTGVVYTDAVTPDSFYTPGEGIGNATITAVRVSDGLSFTTTTWGAGGYSLALSPGTYRVSATSPSLGGSGTITPGLVAIGSRNVKQDFTPATPSVDTTPPTAILAAGDVLLAGVVPYTVAVTYADDSGVAVGSLDSADLDVAGPIPPPGSLTHLAVRLLSVDTPADGSPRTATYAVSPPGGAWDASDNGVYAVYLNAAQVSDTLGNAAPQNLLGSFLVNLPASSAVNRQSVVVGAEAGDLPLVRAFSPTGQLQMSFFPYDPGFRGGVRVASGDVNGDGVPDIITGAGAGAGPHVRVFDGTTGNLIGGPLSSFYAFAPGYIGGITVAAGDVNGDGRADVIVGAASGAGPHVKVFSGADGSVLKSFWAYDPGYLGGITVAAADLNGDGLADVITGPRAAGPHVRAFSGAPDNAILANFMAYNPAFTGGIYVSAGDLTGDGVPDIVTGTLVGPPHVKVFAGPWPAPNGSGGVQAASFYAYDPATTASGVRVAVGADTDADGHPELLAATGPGLSTVKRIKIFGGVADLSTFQVLDAAVGAYVAGSP